jgi:hypothetical protein
VSNQVNRVVIASFADVHLVLFLTELLDHTAKQSYHWLQASLPRFSIESCCVPSGIAAATSAVICPCWHSIPQIVLLRNNLVEKQKAIFSQLEGQFLNALPYLMAAEKTHAGGHTVHTMLAAPSFSAIPAQLKLIA